MSNKSYTKGFCNAALAKGVDPNGLAKFAESMKKAQDAGAASKLQKFIADIKKSKAAQTAAQTAKTVAGSAKKKYDKFKETYKNLSSVQKDFVNAGIGTTVGTLSGLGLGAALGRPGRGAIIGALSGSGAGALARTGKNTWDKVREAIEKKIDEKNGITSDSHDYWQHINDNRG